MTDAKHRDYDWTKLKESKVYNADIETFSNSLGE